MGPDGSGVPGMPFRRTGHSDRQLVGVSRFDTRSSQVVVGHRPAAPGRRVAVVATTNAARGRTFEAADSTAPTLACPSSSFRSGVARAVARGVAAGWRDARQRRATLAFRGPQGPQAADIGCYGNLRCLRTADLANEPLGSLDGPDRAPARWPASANRVVSTQVARGFRRRCSCSGNLVRGGGGAKSSGSLSDPPTAGAFKDGFQARPRRGRDHETA